VRFDETTAVVPDALVQLTLERAGAGLRPDGLVWPLESAETALDGLGLLLEKLRASL
jgi:hypothetical protein